MTDTALLQAHIDRVIDQMIDQMHDLAVAHVKKRATELMVKHPNLKTFCLAMGTVCFYSKRGPLDPKPYTRELIDFVDQLDDRLGLTGAVVKLTREPDGSIAFTDQW